MYAVLKVTDKNSRIRSRIRVRSRFRIRSQRDGSADPDPYQKCHGSATLIEGMVICNTRVLYILNQRDGQCPTFGDLVTILRKGSMQDITVASLQNTRAQTPLSPSFKCNVLRESLSVESQNIPCATPDRKGPWVISVSLY